MESKKVTILEYIMEYLFLFFLGGAIYYGIEILWRGYSHPTMAIVGGICFIGIGLINEIFSWNMSIWKQVILGDLFVLLVEFIAGCILNIWLDLGIWDYSTMPFNLLGQICLPFAFLWLPIVFVAIILDDWAKFILKKGERPHYNWKWNKKKGSS